MPKKQDNKNCFLVAKHLGKSRTQACNLVKHNITGPKFKNNSAKGKDLKRIKYFKNENKIVL